VSCEPSCALATGSFLGADAIKKILERYVVSKGMMLPHVENNNYRNDMTNDE
jgi:hypothetical protein